MNLLMIKTANMNISYGQRHRKTAFNLFQIINKNDMDKIYNDEY